MVITNATAEQWAAIERLRVEMIANTTLQYDNADITKTSHEMYRAIGLREPIVLVADSPMQMVVMSSLARVIINGIDSQLRDQLRSQLRDQLDSQLYDQLSSQLSSQLRSQLDRQPGSQLGDQLHSQLHSQLSSRLYDELSSQLRDQLRSQLRSQLSSQLYDELSSQLRDQLRSQLRDQLDSQLYDQLSSQLRSQLRDQLRSQLRDQLYSQLSGQLGDQLDSQLYSQLRDQLRSQLEKERPYVGQFWRVYSAWYAAAKILGVQFDADKLSLFRDFGEMANTWCAWDGLFVVSRNPIAVHWRDGELHNESGMAVEFADGWGLYTIAGVAVDEQIVMRPESQTVEQIRREKNEEVKRIRIERYGWERFVSEVGAAVVDQRRNDIDGTTEALFSLPDGEKVFVGRCRSTGRVYFLEVDPSIDSCEQSQRWMRSVDGVCIGAS